MPKKFSFRRYKASIRNGAQSPGPSTPEAKHKVAQNALAHGLTAKSMLLPGEDAELFRRFAEGFREFFQPANTVELALFEQLVDAHWRARRTGGTEGSVYQMTMLRNREKVEKEFENAGPDIHYAAAFEHLANRTNTLNQLHRQETRISRLQDRLLRQLLEIRQAGKPTDLPDPPVSHTPEPASNALKENTRMPTNQNLQNNPEPPENPPSA